MRIMEDKSGRKCRSRFYEGKYKGPPRLVPAFTYQSLQKHTYTGAPAKINLFKKQPVKETLFSMYFNRGDIPAGRSGGVYNAAKLLFPVKWFCNPLELDYCYYLPIFIDGLAEPDQQMRRLAMYSAMDLIIKAPHKILPVLPKLIIPMKRAFNTRDKKIIIGVLQVLQLMVLYGPCVGQALVPYYRQLLAICNLYKNINVNMGCGIDDERGNRIGDVIEDTLKLLERCGGPDAFINIKYMIPTYESNTYPRCELAVPAEQR